MAFIKPYPVSTYQTCYTARPILPRVIKYHDVPSLAHRVSRQQPPQGLPTEPKGPTYHLAKNAARPVLKNIISEKFSEPKTAEPNKIRNKPPGSASQKKDGLCGREESKSVGTPERVFDTKFGKMDINLINSLVDRVRWTSTTTVAAEEACLPVATVKPPDTTVEHKADMVKLRGQRYESEAADWQKSVFWDCTQLRGIDPQTDLLTKTHGQPEKLLAKRKKIGESGLVISDKIRHLVHSDELSNIYVRQCPGYAGFVPRSPPEGVMEKKPEAPQMVSTMKGTYKRLPLEEYKPQHHARKAPLSKTVTLTYPFNPYNKVVAKSPIV